MKTVEACILLFLWLAFHAKEPAGEGVWQQPQAEQEAQVQTKQPVQAVAASWTETEIFSGAYAASETEIISESYVVPETERYSETSAVWETEPCSDSFAETETESFSEVETEPLVVDLSGLCLDYEEGYKTYDDTTKVRLRADTAVLPEGMCLELWGETAEPDVGAWEVAVHAALLGEGSGDYELRLPSEPPVVTVVPRPLTVEIDDARKLYFTEPAVENLEFPYGKENPLHVSGFMRMGEETDEMPEGFEMPQLAIDEQVLQKNSPMYRDGRPYIYENAVILKTERGELTGNPTLNYCFVTDPSSPYYRPGSVTLRAPLVAGTLDYTVRTVPEQAMCMGGDGTLWLPAGTTLCVEAKKGSGFSQGAVSDPVSASGSFAFRLKRYAANGELLAESAEQYLDYCVDDVPPQGRLYMEEMELAGEAPVYIGEEARISIAGVQDEGSGVKSVWMFADEKLRYAPESIGRENAVPWENTTQVRLKREGQYRIYARLEDRTGNVQYLASPVIVLDRTPPKLVITGVQDGSANRGKVKPVIRCSDAWYREGSLRVEFEGYRIGKQPFDKKRSVTAQGEEIRVKDIPHEQRWDDCYVMRVSAEDLSGNRTEQTVEFSVNRFGSVYAVDEETAQRLDRYYLTEAQPMVLREINVDYLTEASLVVGYDGRMRTLEKGRDYELEQSVGAQGWKEYRYMIKKENFSKEGVYRVLLATKDRAQNRSDNRMRKLDLEFAVDRSAPSILVHGLEDQKHYCGESLSAEMECRDNLALAGVRVWKNGELLWESAKNPQTAVLEGREQRQIIELKADEAWQTVEVEAVDAAGNETRERVQFYLHPQRTGAAVPPKPGNFAAVSRGAETQSDAEAGETASQSTAGAKKPAKQQEALAEGEKQRKKKVEKAVAFGILFCLGIAVFCVKSPFFHKNIGVKE